MLYYLINGKEFKPPKKEEEDPRKTIFTKEELRKYNGTGPDGKIYVAVHGLVFDVTESGFY